MGTLGPCRGSFHRLFALLLAVAPAARADDWPGPLTREVFSRSREYFVRVVPGESLGDTYGFAGRRRAATRRRSSTGASADRSYRLVAEVPLLNPVAPYEFFVADDGRLATLDNWHNLGYGKVVSVYDARGKLVRAYELRRAVSGRRDRRAFRAACPQSTGATGRPTSCPNSKRCCHGQGGSGIRLQPRGGHPQVLRVPRRRLPMPLSPHDCRALALPGEIDARRALRGAADRRARRGRATGSTRCGTPRASSAAARTRGASGGWRACSASGRRQPAHGDVPGRRAACTPTIPRCMVPCRRPSGRLSPSLARRRIVPPRRGAAPPGHHGLARPAGRRRAALPAEPGDRHDGRRGAVGGKDPARRRSDPQGGPAHRALRDDHHGAERAGRRAAAAAPPRRRRAAVRRLRRGAGPRPHQSAGRCLCA